MTCELTAAEKPAATLRFLPRSEKIFYFGLVFNAAMHGM
jgi:hypothetical protein